MTVPSGRINYQGQTISTVNPPQTIQLKSGDIFYVPNGNFVVKSGPQSAIQWQDDYSGLWRNLDADYPGTQVLQSDGNNYRIINLSGTITGANITAAGSAYTQANTTLSFAAAPSTGVTATATPIIGGSLTFAVTTAGSGYTQPFLIIPAPYALGGTQGMCIPATANLTLSTGTISAIVTGFAGAGYLTAPLATSTLTITPAQYQANPSQYLYGTQMVIVDPVGQGAVITATLANGNAASGGLTGMIITNPGAGYTSIPAITVSSATGSSATAVSLPSFSLTGVTVGGTNTGYTAPVVGQSSLGLVTQQVFDETVLPRAARVTFPAPAGVVGAAVIEDAGSGFQAVPSILQFVNSGSNATFTATVGGVTNTLLLWQVG